MNAICTAKTASGKQCTRPSGPSGLCAQHLAKQQRSRYDDIVHAVISVCERRGWKAYLSRNDPDYQFVEVVCKKYVNGQDVSAIIYATVVDGVQYRIEKTSFYNYGQKDLFAAVKMKIRELDWIEKKPVGEKSEKSESASSYQIVSRVLRNFDRSARQLKRRYASRDSFEIDDEYDAQDLLHALLRAYFDDVRAEEYTPSYAGSSSRVDFLLKVERAVVELKFATPKLRDKHIGEQLILDIKKYQGHPDCKVLYCLVYDPEGNIRNPIGLENDLTGKHDDLTVYVYVVPN